MRKSLLLFMVITLSIFIGSIALAQETPANQPAKFQQPILISSAGQSADVKLVGMLAKKQKLDAKVVSLAKPADLQGVKSLIIVPGFSSKGLGAAGVSQTEELERISTLVTEANKLNIPIIVVHIGGNARRKGNSDAFNQLAAESSKYMIVVEQGDEDKFFTTIANEKKIPLELVPKIALAAEPLGNLFK